MYTTRFMRRRLYLLLLCLLVVAQFHAPAARAEEEGAAVTPLRLFNLQRSGAVDGGRGVSGVPRFAPNSEMLVYSFAETTGDTLMLYSVPTRAGEPILLSPTVATGSQYQSVLVTADGSRVVYRDSGASAVNIDGVELYSVPIQGGTPVKLNGTLPTLGAHRSVTEVRLTPDSADAIYVAPLVGGNGSAIYRVPVAGGSSVQLSGAHGATGSILFFILSGDGTKVIYYSLSPAGRELYAIDVSGGAPVKIGATLPAGREIGDVAISADGEVVVYAVVESALGTDREIAISSAETATGAATLLAEAYTSAFYIPLVGGYPSHFQLAPNGSRVVYMVKSAPNQPFELYTIATGGGTPGKLNVPLEGASSTLGVGVYVIAPNSSRVVYSVRTTPGEGITLYSVPLTGGVSASLGGAASASSNITNLRVSPDSSQVVYALNPAEILVAPLGGGAPKKLAEPMAAGAQIRALEISPNGENVYYVSDQDALGVDELFVVPMAGGTIQKVNGQMTEGGDVGFARWSISPDSSAVAYVADQVTNEVTELFATFEVPAVLIPIVDR